MANNITEVRLLNVPLENDYLHTLYFASLSAQTSYFTGLPHSKRSDLSYQRKDGFIRYPDHYDNLQRYNYVMYKNAKYSSKWYYAFITKMEYKDDGRTDIYIETDVLQTWMFDYTVKPSFIEREHVADDSLGLHTIPEPVETGDYMVNSINKCVQLNYKAYIVASTIDLSDAHHDDVDLKTAANVSGKVYGGIYSGVRYYIYTSSEDLNKVIKNLADAGRSDAITSIFIVPLAMVSMSGHEVGNVSEGDLWGTVTDGGTVVQRPNYKPLFIGGNYEPRNNKLFTFPYSYMLMSNNSGSSAIYKYELFNMDNQYKTNCDFKIYGALTPGFSCRLVPQNYNGIEENNEEGLNLGKLPICNWNTDVYTNWLTQNAVNIGATAISNVVTIAGGVGLMLTGAGALAGAGAVATGLIGITNSVGQIYEHSLRPPQAEGNLNSGDVTYSMGDLTFSAYHMSIKKEFAEVIDGYFDMFGYKVNQIKVPNKNHRENYWYTKTIDVNIDGAIPMDDMKKIKNCYNSGITFWKSASNIQNYSVSNNTV